MELRRVGLSWSTVGDELVILDLEDSKYLKLNGSASFLWQQISESSDQDILVARLTEKFAIGEERAREDVSAFLSDMRQRHLLVE